jgi:hypothetical protein
MSLMGLLKSPRREDRRTESRPHGIWKTVFKYYKGILFNITTDRRNIRACF